MPVNCRQVAPGRKEGFHTSSVERGARALPLKVVITTTDEPAQPQFAATLKWDLKTRPAASAFTYVPAKVVHRIELKPVAAAK